MKILATILLLCGLGWAQSSELLRPTADGDPGATTWATLYCGPGGYVANSSMPLAYDSAGLTTSSSVSLSTRSTAGKKAAHQFSSWQSTANTYTSLTINVNAKVISNNGGAAIVYSTNGGSSWTKLASVGSIQTTYSATITGALVANVKVGVCVEAISEDGVTLDTDTLVLYDIWTSGTLSPQSAGNGSGSGTAVQPVQFN